MSIIPSVAVDTIEQCSMSISKGKTLYVGGSGEGNYTTIQSAINDTSDGDTVFVFDDSSPYYENINVDKRINLIGENRETTIIDGSGSGNVARIYADWVNISGFTIQNSGNNNAGIVIIDQDYNNISNNNLPNNGIGLWLYFSGNITITDNKISNNRFGMILDSSSTYNSITGNNVSNNVYGIILDYSSNNNVIYHNNFINNPQDAYDKCDNIWDNGESGNYWDDYTGEDKDGDGIGDTPYPIPGGDNEDRYPLMEPWPLWNNSPPNKPDVTGPNSGKPGVKLNYTFASCDPDGDDVYYLINWGDGTVEDWSGPYPSCQIVEISHKWSESGVYYIRAKARDINGAESEWSDRYKVAIGNKPPNAPTITGRTSGKAGKRYEYTINAVDPNGDNVKYFINWGDNTSEWTGFNASGTDVKVKHTWIEGGTYNITAKAQDIHGSLGPEGTLTVNIPRSRTMNSPLLLRLFERFPLLEVFLRTMNLLK